MELRQPFNVDIQFIDEQPALGGIGTDVVRTGVAEGVQWIDPDQRGSKLLTRPLDNVPKVGKVSHTPIRHGPQRIELKSQSPDLLRSLKHLLDIALRGSHNEFEGPALLASAPGGRCS